MTKKAVVFDQFEGGWSTDTRLGIPHSFPFSQAFDFRKSPSGLSVLPAPTREDKKICKDLIVNTVMSNDGSVYGYGDAGYFYKRTTSGVWSSIGTTGTGYFGMDYRKDADSIYLAGSKAVTLYNPVSSNAAMLVNKYASSASFYNNSTQMGFNVNANQQGSILTTQLTVATNPLNENSTTVRYFQTDIEPLNKIQVNIVNKGTGDWTMTLHDGLNNVLATSTVANGNLNNNSWNDFNFTTAPNAQVRVYPAPNARTYHFHLTSTVADGTVSSSTMNDLSSCDVQIYADRMVVTNNGYHPIKRFQQFECIGNANYLSVWEPITDTPTNAEWQRHKLVFPEEYEVCGLDTTNEFIIIAAEKNTTGTNTPQEGILFFWDGLEPTYNYDVPIAEGSPQGLHTYQNVAYYYAGGDWWAITSPLTQPVKLRNMPGSATEYTNINAPITVYPYAATVRRGVHLMAFPSKTTNGSVQFGVYSWGQIDKNYPESFGYNYVISTGSQNYTFLNGLRIGNVKAFGDLLFISWEDDQNGGYGIDVISNTSTPAQYAKWQGLVFGGAIQSKYKSALYMDVYYYFPAGASIVMSYQIDNLGWVSSPAYSITNLWNNGQNGNNYARFDITNQNGGRFHEIQLQIEVFGDGTVTSPPTIQAVGLVYDDNSSEAL